MKKIGLVLLVLLNSLMVFGNESISVGVLNGPSTIPVARMMDKIDEIDECGVEYEKFATPKTLLPKLIKNEVDIGFLPVNVAAKVYNSSNGAVICCGISGRGNLYLLSNDETVNSLSDLSGKKVYVAGKGATPDFLFRYILEKNNINDVEIDFSIPTNQLAAAIVSEKIDNIVIPEPFVTIAMSRGKKVRSVIDFQKEYKTITGDENDYPLTVIVATKDFVENHSDLLVKFLEKYKESYEWTLRNPNMAGDICNELDLFNASVAAKAIPNSNYCFVKASDCVDEIESFLQLFLNYAPESIGGKLPEKEFYFTEE